MKTSFKKREILKKMEMSNEKSKMSDYLTLNDQLNKEFDRPLRAHMYLSSYINIEISVAATLPSPAVNPSLKQCTDQSRVGVRTNYCARAGAKRRSES